jgi:hypothetical protein
LPRLRLNINSSQTVPGTLFTRIWLVLLAVPSRNTPAKKTTPLARKAAPARASSSAQPENNLPLNDDDRAWLARQAAIGATTHHVQAAAEGVEIVDDDHVEFMGRRFRRAERIGLMPLMHMAIASKKGIDTADMEGLAAMYELLRDCIDQTRPQEEREDPENPGETIMVDTGPSEWDKFEQHALDMKAEAEDIQKVVTDVMVQMSARPSRRPGDSPAGPRLTQGNSKVSSLRTDMHLPDSDGMTSVDSLQGL